MQESRREFLRGSTAAVVSSAAVVSGICRSAEGRTQAGEIVVDLALAENESLTRVGGAELTIDARNLAPGRVVVVVKTKTGESWSSAVVLR